MYVSIDLDKLTWGELREFAAHSQYMGIDDEQRVDLVLGNGGIAVTGLSFVTPRKDA